MQLPKKVQEWIYLISTNDKYSEWDYRKSFNRVNKPQDNLYSHHNLSTTGLIGPDGDHHDSVINLENGDNTNFSSLDGVHEVRLAWRHIKNWIDRYNPDLASSLLSKCTDDDLHDFQKDLNIKFPVCVLEFFKLTDGQGNFGNDVDINGLFFGLKLMPLDEILILTEHWRKVAQVLNEQQSKNKVELPQLQLSYNNPNQKKPTSSPFIVPPHPSSSSQTHSKLKMNTQSSIPPNQILNTYAHPMWIPIITDEVGNCIGIDLSPPATGTWGQVILFGRDFDVKYKIADNFGDFLLLFANDLEIGNWDLRRSKKNGDGDLFIGNEGELIFVDKETKLEVPYFQILKQRAIHNWITSLEKENSEISPENKKILQDITTKDKTLLTYKPETMDKFINNNISDIDAMNQPMASNSSSSSTSSLPSGVMSTSTLPSKVNSGNASKINSPATKVIIEEDIGDGKGLQEIDI